MKIPLARLAFGEKGAETKAAVNPCPSVAQLLFLG